MVIEELKQLTAEDQKAIQGLMMELEGCTQPEAVDATGVSASGSAVAGSAERLKAVLADANAHLFVLRDEAGAAGCATLCVAHTPEFTLGFVEAVVVNPARRGCGYGKALMNHVLASARSLGVDSIHLTSNPRRTAANALYRSLGFTLYDTNCYRMDL